jgi:hypothetical protein
MGKSKKTPHARLNLFAFQPIRNAAQGQHNSSPIRYRLIWLIQNMTDAGGSRLAVCVAKPALQAHPCADSLAAALVIIAQVWRRRVCASSNPRCWGKDAQTFGVPFGRAYRAVIGRCNPSHVLHCIPKLLPIRDMIKQESPPNRTTAHAVLGLISGQSLPHPRLSRCARRVAVNIVPRALLNWLRHALAACEGDAAGSLVAALLGSCAGFGHTAAP